MSLATISAAVVDLVKGVAGVANVGEEEPEGMTEEAARVARIDTDRFHFWRVKVWPIGGEEGAGWDEPRYQIRVLGFYGVARDAPSDGEASDLTFRDLSALVLATLRDKDNRNPGSCVETTAPVMAAPVVRPVQIGAARVKCHVVEITYIAQEE